MAMFGEWGLLKVNRGSWLVPLDFHHEETKENGSEREEKQREETEAILYVLGPSRENWSLIILYVHAHDPMLVVYCTYRGKNFQMQNKLIN